MNLNIQCPINTLSYGYVSSFFIKELLKKDYDLRHIPIGHPDPDENIAPCIKDAISRWDFFHDAPCLKIWHQHDLHSFTGKGKSIGFPIFELEEFNPVEKHSLAYPDFLFTCSEWGRNVICKNDHSRWKTTHVVPLGYDNGVFKPVSLPPEDTTVFGNFGKFEIRKGHDVLIKAFNKAFEKEDNVKLIMMPHNFFLNQEETNHWLKMYYQSKLGDKIEFVNRVKTQQMAYNIMSNIHCGVFPARAEGWNLEALELLAIGRHLIITNCTGHTEFCNSSNSKLIEMESGTESAFDGKFFHGQGSWRSITENEIDQMVEHMREVHKLHQNGLLKINQTGIDSVQKFTWPSVTNILDKKIREVTGA
ncbi:MAG: hypothetical protein CL833_04990 [Crocinitomicaceae bacterium]|nr:hypothetical protein [Crocinitomicaceae bacterium]|tara:strand:+ start:3097 stop:4182 length:1086 start_codon:yes stop_codon:yes gene_type:complete